VNFSVIIPTYNRALLIAKTLRSVLAQTLSPVEILVIDDQSTDDTEAVVRETCSGAKYVRIKNSGPAVARTIGAGRATGDWIAFCDSDDIWDPNHLATLASVHEIFPESEFVFSNFCNFTVDPRATFFDNYNSAPSGWWDRFSERRDARAGKLNQNRLIGLLEFNPVWPSNSAVQRDVFRRVGKTPAALSHLPCEDGDLTRRMVASAETAFATATTVRIRRHHGNLSGNQTDNLVGSTNVLLIGLMENSQIFGPCREQIVDIALSQVAEACSNAIYKRHFIEAGHLFSLSREAGVTLPNRKHRIIGRLCALRNPLTAHLLRPRLGHLIETTRSTLSRLDSGT
jgi:GT2 family glycosyltransferase